MALKLPRLPSGFKIINRDGSPTDTFQLWWNNVAGQLETNINGVLLALEAAGIAVDAAEAAQLAADAAQTAATAGRSESSIVNSGIINVMTPPLLSASSLGVIFISDHSRSYGDPTLNPTVSVTGSGGIVTAYTPGDLVYVYYDDPARAGGIVTYQTSLVSSDAIQGGNRHSIGSVTVPAAGTSDGLFVQPPGVLS